MSALPGHEIEVKIMTVETITRREASQKNNFALEAEPAEGIILEADYAEDRPIALLAERQREFQKSVQGQYVDTKMPAS